MSLLDLFLVFYGYLSLSFGWLFYIVVFTSFGIALYSLVKERSIYRTSEVFIKSITYLGTIDLLLSTGVAAISTLKWLIGTSV